MHAGVVISSEQRGGAEEYLLRLYEGVVDRHGFDATLFGHLEGWGPRTSRTQIDVGLGPKWSRSSACASLQHMVTERRTALRLITGYPRPVDYYHVQFKREQILLTSVLAQRHPVIWTEHGTLPRGKAWSLLRPWYRRAALASSVVICVSEEVEASVVATCGKGVRTVVIENAIDEQRFRPVDDQGRRDARIRLGLAHDDMVIVVVSRLHPGKRLERAIAAVAPESGVTMIVAGDGPDRMRLEQLAAGRPDHLRRLAGRARRPVSGRRRVSLQRNEDGRRVPNHIGTRSDHDRLRSGGIRRRHRLQHHPGVWGPSPGPWRVPRPGDDRRRPARGTSKSSSVGPDARCGAVAGRSCQRHRVGPR